MSKYFSNSARGYVVAIIFAIFLTSGDWLIGDDRGFTWTVFLISASAGFIYYVGCEFSSIHERIRDLESRLKYLPKPLDD